MEILKRCAGCKNEKLLSEFHKRKGSKDGHDHHCKECGNSRHRNKYQNDNEYKKRIQLNTLKRTYKLSDIELQTLHSIKYCQICGIEILDIRKKYIDHDHNSGNVRGILCPKCNMLLGCCSDNINILENAIMYLKSH